MPKAVYIIEEYIATIRKKGLSKKSTNYISYEIDVKKLAFVTYIMYISLYA